MRRTNARMSNVNEVTDDEIAERGATRRLGPTPLPCLLDALLVNGRAAELPAVWEEGD